MHTHETFKLQTDIFEGPLELLLELIERKKLLINDISLSTVADEYIRYLQELEDFPLSEAAHFVLVASTLLLLKSRSLLPLLQFTDEEEMDAQELEHRLTLYKEVRELSAHVQKIFGVHVSFSRTDKPTHAPIFTPTHEITIQGLHAAARNLIGFFPQKDELSKVMVEKVMSLEDMIDTLATRMKDAVSMSFKTFADSRTNGSQREARLNTVVSFLALLELVKEGLLFVEQQKSFADITMESLKVDV